MEADEQLHAVASSGEMLYMRSPRATARRLPRTAVAIVVVIGLCSGTWHLLRPALTRALALASFGLPHSSPLAQAVIRDRYPSLIIDESPRIPWSECTTMHGGGAVLRQMRAAGPAGNAAYSLAYVSDELFDSDLRHLASLPVNVFADPSSLADRDGDGSIEVRAQFTPRDKVNAYVGYYGSAVIRIRAGETELVGAIAVPAPATAPTAPAFVYWRWVDDDGDGISELAGETIQRTAKPLSGAFTWKSLSRIATVAWDRQGGVLRLREGPAGATLVVADLKDGPIRFTRDDDLIRWIADRLVTVEPDETGAGKP